MERTDGRYQVTSPGYRNGERREIRYALPGETEVVINPVETYKLTPAS